MGTITQSKEECRDMRHLIFIFIDDLLRDLRYAWRNLRRSPGFSLLAILIMALGVGANTAGFFGGDARLLKPPAPRASARTVTLSHIFRSPRAPPRLLYQVPAPPIS